MGDVVVGHLGALGVSDSEESLPNTPSVSAAVDDAMPPAHQDLAAQVCLNGKKTSAPIIDAQIRASVEAKFGQLLKVWQHPFQSAFLCIFSSASRSTSSARMHRTSM